MRQLRALLVAVFFAVILLGCGGGTAPFTQPRMLVYKQAAGRVFGELRKGYAQQTYRPGMSLKSVSLFVVDGNFTSPQEIGALSVVDDALAAGVPVLLLNAELAHKQSLAQASNRIGAVLGGRHQAMLITPRSHGMDVLHLGTSKGAHKSVHARLSNNGVLTGQHSESRYELDPDDISIKNFVDGLNARVSGRLPQELNRGTDPPSSIPRYIVSVTDAFTSINGNVVPGQTVTTNVTFFYNVYYNDGGPGQQYQWLIAYATGLADPGSPANDSERTKGYYQRYVQVQMAPNPSENGNLLIRQEQQPTAASNSYQASISANIQYNGGQNSYDWSLSLPGSAQSIPGWGVTESDLFENPINATGWLFYQESPYNVLSDNWHDGFTYVSIWVLDYKPKDMNTTSTTQFPINVGSVWRTQTATTNGIAIQYGVGAQYEQLHAAEDSPGIYDRDRTQQTLAPDLSSITLLFGRAS